MNTRIHIHFAAISSALVANLAMSQSPLPTQPSNSAPAPLQSSVTRPLAISPKLGSVLIAVPDVAFDVAQTRAQSTVEPFNITLKNVGASASAAFVVKCDFNETRIPPASPPRIAPKTTVFDVPAIAAGASYVTHHARPPVDGSAFFGRSAIKCVADAARTSGEVNRANNVFEFSPPNAAVPDIAFDAAAMTQDARDNGGRIIVKNVGSSVNQPFKVACETEVDVLLFDGRKERQTTSNTINVPHIPTGSTHTHPGLNGAWVVQRVNCIADAANTSGETNKTNNTFAYQRAADVARADLAAPFSGKSVPPTYLGAPDLAFDVPAMTADASRRGSNPSVRTQVGYRIAVKNVGKRASQPAEVVCTDVADFVDTTPGPNAGRALPRRTWNWSRAVPAVAPGATYTDQVEVLGNEDLIRRTCVIDAKSVSGDSNKANNTYEFQKTGNLTAPVAPALGG
jgi:hypothetical protein